LGSFAKKEMTMRKVYWSALVLLALPFLAAHACGGDDSTGGAGTKNPSGSGGTTGSTTSTTAATTTGTTGGTAGR
jgi:hypothetical protein